jgi:hypothetical protein
MPGQDLTDIVNIFYIADRRVILRVKRHEQNITIPIAA